MKFCPRCSETYADESLNFCLSDGTPLQAGSGSLSDQQTAILTDTISSRPTVINAQGTKISSSGIPHEMAPSMPGSPKRSRSWIWAVGILGLVVLLCGSGFAGLMFYGYKAGGTANRSVASTPASVSPSPFTDAEAAPADTTDSENVYTMAQYNRISVGMSRSAVEDILGSSGEQLSSFSTGDSTYTVDQWEGKNYSSIIISFTNDKVISKSQAGLK